MKALWIVLSGILIAGCATKKIDWNTRVNNFHYDQAIPERAQQVVETMDETGVTRGQIAEKGTTTTARGRRGGKPFSPF